MKAKALNGFVFLRPIEEKRVSDSGFEYIAGHDMDKRHDMGEVYDAAEGTKLEEGDRFLYDNSTAFPINVNGEMMIGVHFSRVIGIFN